MGGGGAGEGLVYMSWVSPPPQMEYELISKMYLRKASFTPNKDVKKNNIAAVTW